MKYIARILSAACFSLMLTACSEDEAGYVPGLELQAPTVTAVTSSQAVLNASATGAAIVNRGFCYGTEANPTIERGMMSVPYANMTAVLRNLKPGTTYHVRSFIKTNSQLVYSNDVTFTTSASIGQADLDAWVAPTYQDDYRDFSGWDQRYRWNLSNVHDPTVMKADDGYYYMYQTDASFGNAHAVGGGHFHCRRSLDLVTWEYLGASMKEVPSWVLEQCNAYRAEAGLEPITKPSYLFWAPCARKVRSGLYRMYYAIGMDNYIKSGKENTSANFDGTWTERAFIGVMETADPASNNWVDRGMVVCSSTDKAIDGYSRASLTDFDGYFYFNAIDPCYIVVPDDATQNAGEHWLVYGSWHSGIAAVQLDPETGKTLAPLGKPWAVDGSKPWDNGFGKRIWTRDAASRWQASEGPEVVYHNGYFYLFMAYDQLGTVYKADGSLDYEAPYNTRVLRSSSVDGSYAGFGSNQIVVTHPYCFAGDHGWTGIAHCGIFSDGEDNWYYVSQQRFASTSGGNSPDAIMLGGVRSIQWTDTGWPVAMPERYAAVPQVPITAEEIAGTWQHIDMSYQRGKMKESQNMVLTADGKITEGPWKNSTWSFDPTTNTLTANGVKLKVQRECNWEDSLRHHTIVYAGIGGTGKTYWGKKQ